VGQEAVLAAGVEVGEQHGDRFPDDPAPVGSGTVAQQREPGAFQVKEFLGGQVNGDLLSVLLSSAGLALVAPVRTRGGRTQEFSDPGQAYPP
jgi:hypothetical protein